MSQAEVQKQIEEALKSVGFQGVVLSVKAGTPRDEIEALLEKVIKDVKQEGEPKAPVELKDPSQARMREVIRPYLQKLEDKIGYWLCVRDALDYLDDLIEENVDPADKPAFTRNRAQQLAAMEHVAAHLMAGTPK